MTYQYLFCASCGTRRAGHGYQCSVCGNLLRHEAPRARRARMSSLRTAVLWQAPVPERLRTTPEPRPVAA